MKLSIIVPIYNEINTINQIVDNIVQVELPNNISKEILLIDDGSSDGTVTELKKFIGKPPFNVILLDKNKGKTEAVKCGISNATGDYILIQDADLEYLPNQYPKLLKPLIEDQCDVVYGSRFKGTIKNMLLINRIANILSNITFNILFLSCLSDINTCFKLFKREIFNKIKIESEDFQFETEISAKLLKNGYRIMEVPIDYQARNKQQGKKINFLRALKMYYGIFKFRF